MKSWKTSIGGVLTAIGAVAVQVQEPAWIATIGAGLIAVGSLLMGVSARDNNVSSEDLKK